ncbi:acyl-CoA N-acyltransferase [Thozetella sp. PMI_491]|nr:acyl-CoA N-acyltransferase [Thozetella sp. PMI_491]
MGSKSGWVSVKTTLPARPLLPNSLRPVVTTDRLIIRAIVPEDLHGLHILRTQPEIMLNNPQGRIDRDLEETRPKIEAYLPPKDETTFNFTICLKDTGEMIGLGGVYSLSSLLGWPSIGYMFRKEFWGQGLATEFVRAFLDMYSKLSREPTEITVDPRTLSDKVDGPVLEQIATWTTSENIASQKVLQKCGFEQFKTWKEPDLRKPEVEIELVGFRYFPTRSLKS